MKNCLISVLMIAVLIVTACTSCDSDISGADNSKAAANLTSVESGTANSKNYNGTIDYNLQAQALYPDTYSKSDYTKWTTYNFGTEYVFDVASKSWDGASPSEDVATVTIKNKNLKVENKSEQPLNIRLTGTNSAYKVTVDGNGQAVKVTLDNLNIASGDRALNIKNSAVTYIVLEGNNSLETQIYSADKNVLKSEADLIIDGTGSLSVTANAKNGIVSEQGVVCILGGNTTVTVAQSTWYTNDNDTEDDTSDDTIEETKGTGIKAMLGFVMLDGNLTVYGNNCDKGYESKGIKVDGYEADEIDESLCGSKGWIVIDGGSITVRTQGKAISAGWKQSEDDVPTSESNYPVPNVYINGGTFDIVTYAAPRDDTSAVEGVSPEGIEAKNNLYITGGTLVINTTDDCLNASNGIYISGGLVYAKASSNDAVDAGAEENQGELCISGGVIIAMGSGAPETGLDCNADSRFKYTGGTFIALGGAQSNAPLASGTTAYTVAASGFSAGKTYALVQNDTVVLAFTVPSGYSYGNCGLLGADSLSPGSAILLTGVTASGDSNLNGSVLSGNVSVSGGTAVNVTVENTASGGFGAMPGQIPGGTPGQFPGFPGGRSF